MLIAVQAMGWFSDVWDGAEDGAEHVVDDVKGAANDADKALSAAEGGQFFDILALR